MPSAKARSSQSTLCPIVQRLLSTLTLTFALTLQGLAAPPQQKVLVVNVSGGGYDAEGMALYEQAQAAGALATFVNLETTGQVKTALESDTYQQVWIFDLSLGGDEHADDWSAVATWFLANTNRPIICDGRISSSLWAGRAPTEERALAQNYYENLKAGNGGLLLGTDHEPYQSGINSINQRIGLRPFSRSFETVVIPVDTNHPLMRSPNDLGATLSDDSSPGMVPFGLQPNGLMLYPIGWHAGDLLSPGISTTIPSGTSLRVQITSPADSAVFTEGESITFTATSSDGEPPVQFLWNSDLQGSLGQGATLSATLQPGDHVVTVTGLDASNRIAVTSVPVTVRRKADLKANIATAVEVWWASEAGKTYQVQWAPEAEPANWQNLGSPIASAGGTMSVFDSTRVNGRRFYRIVAE